MRSPWRDQGARPNWLLAGVLTLAGLLLTAIAYPMTSEYVQGVLVQLGTTVLMFAAVTLAEPWLLSPLRRPRTIAEAQERLRPYVGSAAVPDGRVGTVAAEVKAAADQVRQVLRDAGFWMAHAERGDEQMTFVDWRYGVAGRSGRAGHPARVEWTVGWSGGVLRHTVRVNGVRLAEWRSEPLGESVTVRTRAQLDRFAQQEVLNLMCVLVNALERGYRVRLAQRLRRRLRRVVQRVRLARRVRLIRRRRSVAGPPGRR